MPRYIYKARDNTGKLVKGSMDGAGKEEIIDKLHKMGYMATQVTQAISGIKIETAFDKFKKAGEQDMIVFYIQLSNMISAGINILTALRTLSRQAENRRLKEIIGDVERNVEAGDSLSSAFAKHPRMFSRFFVNMIRAGEASGQIAAVLSRFAQYVEDQAELRQKIKSALFYPIILLCAGVAVTLFVITFIIPQFAEIFLKAGVQLPLVTLILYKVGFAIKSLWFSFVFLGAVFILGGKFYKETKRGALQVDRIKLKLPLIGSLYRKACVSRFSRTLATLIASGVPILEALDIVRDVIGNEVLSGVVENTRNSVEKGQSLAEPLKISQEFPLDAVQMITVGEETGNLDKMLNKVADFYDMSLGYSIKKITIVIEPLILVVMGAMVGFIMASIILPIFDMMKVLRS